MADGHTKQGNWLVKVELTEDEVQQLIRSMNWAKQMDSHEDKPGYPQRMEVFAHRLFLEGILDKLRQAVEEQRNT